MAPPIRSFHPYNPLVYDPADWSMEHKEKSILYPQDEVSRIDSLLNEGRIIDAAIEAEDAPLVTAIRMHIDKSMVDMSTRLALVFRHDLGDNKGYNVNVADSMLALDDKSLTLVMDRMMDMILRDYYIIRRR